MANEITITVHTGSMKFRREITIQGHPTCKVAVATKMISKGGGWRIYVDNKKIDVMKFREIEFALLNYLKGETK